MNDCFIYFLIRLFPVLAVFFKICVVPYEKSSC
ncbi:MAG: hypothetical protein JWQ09_2952, partial [Segetibacter sp.]|nr:hypothetical protein [Segetibacter sp.]